MIFKRNHGRQKESLALFTTRERPYTHTKSVLEPDDCRYTYMHGEGDIRFVSPKALDAAFRKVAPDFVVAGGNHVEEASWDV